LDEERLKDIKIKSIGKEYRKKGRKDRDIVTRRNV
jgi:hypothetical protein